MPFVFVSAVSAVASQPDLLRRDWRWLPQGAGAASTFRLGFCLRPSLSAVFVWTHTTLPAQDLENYVFEQIPQMAQLSDLEKDFYPYYVFTAVRKFVFFLDPMKKGS